MKMLKKICLVLGLFLALSMSGAVALNCEFGTKVIDGDADVGLHLENFQPVMTPVAAFYLDNGPTRGAYDMEDTVYLHFGGAVPVVVSANDIRLTKYENHFPGTKAKAGDSDMGQPLIALPWNFYYMNLYATIPGYDLDDPIYLKAPGPTATGDVRISPLNGIAGGTKVFDFHPDHNKPTILFETLPWPAPCTIGFLRFYNANGNRIGGIPIYDYPDDVYLDISNIIPFAPPRGIVTPNSVRLTV